jgi:hypothetical protein
LGGRVEVNDDGDVVDDDGLQDEDRGRVLEVNGSMPRARTAVDVLEVDGCVLWVGNEVVARSEAGVEIAACSEARDEAAACYGSGLRKAGGSDVTMSRVIEERENLAVSKNC